MPAMQTMSVEFVVLIESSDDDSPTEQPVPLTQPYMEDEEPKIDSKQEDHGDFADDEEPEIDDEQEHHGDIPTSAGYVADDERSWWENPHDADLLSTDEEEEEEESSLMSVQDDDGSWWENPHDADLLSTDEEEEEEESSPMSVQDDDGYPTWPKKDRDSSKSMLVMALDIQRDLQIGDLTTTDDTVFAHFGVLVRNLQRLTEQFDGYGYSVLPQHGHLLGAYLEATHDSLQLELHDLARLTRVSPGGLVSNAVRSFIASAAVWGPPNGSATIDGTWH